VFELTNPDADMQFTISELCKNSILADASHIEICIALNDGVCTFTQYDNGCGIDRDCFTEQQSETEARFILGTDTPEPPPSLGMQLLLRMCSSMKITSKPKDSPIDGYTLYEFWAAESIMTSLSKSKPAELEESPWWSTEVAQWAQDQYSRFLLGPLHQFTIFLVDDQGQKTEFIPALP
jgi:anti-sigma regulatory factor (Ser/Thr protein kinase)